MELQPRLFLKDVLFYLGGVAAVFCCILRSRVERWEVALLGLYYCACVPALCLTLTRSPGLFRLGPPLCLSSLALQASFR